MSRLAWIALTGSGLLAGAWMGGWLPLGPQPSPPTPALLPPRAESAAPRASEPVQPRASAAPAAQVQPPGVGEARPAEPGPRFDVARLGRSGTLVTAGRAAPGAEVALMENGREIGRGRADARGEWVILPDAVLGAGARELTLAMRLPGRPPVEGEGRVVLLVPGAAPARLPEEEEVRPLALLLPRDAPVATLQAGVSSRLTLELVDYGAEGDLRFAGAAPSGAALRMYVDGAPVGDTRADGAGRWSFTAAKALPAGRHTLRVDQLGAQGRVSARIEQPFHREAASGAGGGAAEARRVVQPGQTLWRISREVYGKGMRFTLIYEANREQIRDPNRIFPGQVFSLPAPAASNVSR